MSDDRQPILDVYAETLSVELKSWLDPRRPEHCAVLAKALIALRNRGGGTVIVGMTDHGVPRQDAATFDLRAEYHFDRIQALVSRYASQSFEITVKFPTVGGVEFVRIEVPEGVTTPVAVKSEIRASASGRVLLAHGEVPFRTLRANGTPSTAACRPEDWGELTSICFDNREADVGRFLRRQLGGAGPAVRDWLKEFLVPSPEPPPETGAIAFLLKGEERFDVLTKPPPEAVGMLSPLGGRLVAVTIDPPLTDALPTQSFLRRVLSSVPGYTTYPPWINTLEASGSAAPYVADGAWESLLAANETFDALTFWRLNPGGRFFERRLLLPDVIARLRGEAQGERFDPQGAIVDVAEVMASGLAIASALEVGDDQHSLTFAFKWIGLQGRLLARTGALLRSPYVAQSDSSETLTISLAGDTPPSALAPYVQKILGPVLANFAGYELSPTEVEQGVQALLSRQSGF